MDWLKEKIKSNLPKLYDSLQHSYAIFLLHSDHLIDKFITTLLVISLTLSLIFTYIYVAFGCYYISISSSQVVMPIFKDTTEFIIKLFLGTSPSADIQYLMLVSKTHNIVSIILTFWLSILPVAAIFKYKKESKKQRIIKTQRIWNDKHEMDLLLKYFRNAEEIVIYAVTFRPLKDNFFRGKLAAIMKNHSLRLVSSASENVVRNAIGSDIVDEFKPCFTFDSDTGDMKCSYIKYPSHNRFVYKFSKSDDLDDMYFLANITDDHPSGDTRHLLRALDYLS